MSKRVYLYGIAGPETSYAVVKYMYIEADRVSIRSIINDALWLKMKYPTIKHVYAIDDRPWLLWDYRGAITKKSVESFSIFKNMLERERDCWLSKIRGGSHMRLFSFVYAGVFERHRKQT